MKRRGTSSLQGNIPGFLLALAIAAAAHALAIALWLFNMPSGGVKEAAKPSSMVNMVALSREQMDENRKIAPPPQRPAAVASRQRPRPEDPSAQPPEERVETPAPPEKKEEEKPKPDQRVVDVAPTPDDKPIDPKYVSEYNTRAEKETVSRDRRLNYQSPAPKPQTTREQPTAKVMAPAETTPTPKGMEKKGQSRKAESQPEEVALLLPRRAPKEELKLKLDPELGSIASQPRVTELPGNADRFNVNLEKKDGGKSGGRKGGDKELPLLARLLPENAVAGKFSGAPAPDHLPDVDEGEATFLNTREWKYASFFNRVKRDVSQNWRPDVIFLMRDPTGRVYGYKDRYTLLRIQLEPDGKLRNVAIEESSGVDFLDEEAVRAFYKAAPFGNPPQGLVMNGVIDFKFGFFVEVSGRSQFKLFR
ncbi:MAG: hypothetical protein GMKNLPBB_01843 [Myxococcota bacterium]|nr:hypothetical protein [Myxococcota bacterium]